jgi:hypothetical protein
MNVRYHQQDTDKWCGPATVLMLIDTTGTGEHLPRQDDLAAALHVNNSGAFYTSPERMLAGLNQFVAPNLHGPQFVFNNDPNVAAAMKRVVQSLNGTNPFPPVAAWYHGNHWIVITACTTVPNPPGYSVSCVFVNSPIQLASSARNPPPHARADVCGQPGRGVRNMVVSYDSWRQTFTACDPAYRFMTMTLATRAAARDFVEPKLPLFSAKGMSPFDAAFGAIKTYRLADEGPQADAMSKVDGVGERLRVTDLRLSDPKGDLVQYDYIPLRRGPENVGAMSFDPTGTFMTTAYASDGPVHTVSEDEARSIAIASVAHAAAGSRVPGPVPARAEAIPGALVWRSSTASVFPTFPFYRFRIAESDVFVRLDGEAFQNLTQLDP